MLITRLWKAQGGKYFCISTKSASKKWHDEFFSKSEFKEVQEYIDDNRDKDLYFCPLGFTKRSRMKEYACLPKMLWSDMDEANPSKVKVKPSIAIESSPGRFVGLWLTDKPVTEELNRRLTYFIEADPSGWDLAQVLRIPGTKNYKYISQPRVRTLWIDGPEYDLKELEKKLPELDDAEDEDGGSAADILHEYENKLPQWVRREILNGKPTEGKRSEMFWKLGSTLLEAGMTRSEAFTLLKASPWNKFSGRRNEDEQIRRELDKSARRHLKSGGKTEEPSKYKFLQESMEEVEEENLDWIWYPYLARGELSILEGDPGLGKSYLAEMAGGHFVDGIRLPSVKKLPKVKGKVAYFDIENSAGTVTKKRLTENGFENLRDYYQDEQPFTIDNDEHKIAVMDAIEKLKPILVVFDTLNTYIGKADIHKSSESQQALGWFREIAQRFNCSVLVLRHLTKGTKTAAIYRGQGSIAFAGLARVVMTVGVVPDDPDTRAMTVTKINVTKPPKALTFYIEELPDTVKSQDRSRFKWGEFVDLTSDEMLSAAPEKDTSKGEAQGLLRDMLSDGAVSVEKLERAAEARSISIRTLHRAADEIGVVKKQSGFGKEKVSLWSLKATES